MQETLFAWVKRVSSEPLPAKYAYLPIDHTWVTSYDSRTQSHTTISQVIAARDDYWYCWGSFHPRGGTSQFPDGLIAEAGADLALARCVVTENKGSSLNIPAQGTIFQYGRDGTCHQLANQILYATRSVSGQAAIVDKAYGYLFTQSRWGDYGRPLAHSRFLQKVNSCSSASASSQLTRADMDEPTVPSGFTDSFALRVQRIVGERDPERSIKLLRLRAALLEADEQASEDQGMEEINERGVRFLARAEEILGPEFYRQVFGLEPGQRVIVPEPADEHA